MEETSHSYASKGVAGTALGIGIGGLATALLNGGLGGIGLGLGGAGAMGANLAQSVIADKDSKIARLEAERYTDAAVCDLRKTLTDGLAPTLYALDKRVGQIETALPLQFRSIDDKIACCATAANTAISALQATVSGITKLVVPASAVCPAPMPQFNSWTAPTADTATA